MRPHLLIAVFLYYALSHFYSKEKSIEKCLYKENAYKRNVQNNFYYNNQFLR